MIPGKPRAKSWVRWSLWFGLLGVTLTAGCPSTYPDLSGFACEDDAQCGPNARCVQKRCSGLEKSVQETTPGEKTSSDAGPGEVPGELPPEVPGELPSEVPPEAPIPEAVLCQAPVLTQSKSLPVSCKNRRVCWLQSPGGESTYQWQGGDVLATDSRIYVTGSFHKIKDQSLTARAGTDGFVSAYDTSGKRLWTEVIAGTNTDDRPEAIARMPDGRIVVSGFFYGNATFGDTIQRTSTKSSIGQYTGDGFIAILDPSKPQGQRFQEVWSISLPFFTSVNALAVDANNNIYALVHSGEGEKKLSGSQTITSISRGKSDLLIMKISSAGKLLWSRLLGTSELDYFVGRIVVDDKSTGGVYFVGYHGNSPLLDEKNTILVTSGKGIFDGFVIKLRKQDGKLEWLKSIAGDDEESVRAITLDQKTGDIFVAGTYLGVFTPPYDNAKPVVSNGLRDIFVMRMDSDGNVKWFRHYGSSGNDIPTDLRWSPQGILYLSGFTSQKMELTCHTLSKPDGENGFLFQLNPDTGVVIQMFGLQGAQSQLLRLGLSPDGMLYGLGKFAKETQFDTITSSPNHSTSDLFLLQLNPLLP